MVLRAQVFCHKKKVKLTLKKQEMLPPDRNLPLGHCSVKELCDFSLIHIFVCIQWFIFIDKLMTFHNLHSDCMIIIYFEKNNYSLCTFDALLILDCVNYSLCSGLFWILSSQHNKLKLLLKDIILIYYYYRNRRG